MKPRAPEPIRRLLTSAAGLGATLVLAGCKAGYLVRSGYFQAELLASRTDLNDLRASQALDPAQLRALDVVAAAKQYGAGVGLSATDNYETLAHGWDRQIWNLSACPPLSLEPERWWFPIVGSVPYLGYFREADARKRQASLEARGLEVYVRTAGAYSTLGWFKDPILPGMLEWSEQDLAETVLHELAHATVWVPGSVSFNETFATFVGEHAALGYLADRYGPDSAELRDAERRLEDSARWRALQQALAGDLATLYARADLADDEKRARKAALFAALPSWVAEGGFHEPERYARAASSGTWNNARLAQFRTYHDRRPQLAGLLREADADLLTFMRLVESRTADADDPWAALAP